MNESISAIGVDLGGTKIEMAEVDENGTVKHRLNVPTDVHGGPKAVEKQILSGVEKLRREASSSVVGVGIGVAGQIDANTGLVHFAPNLDWHDFPLQENLNKVLKMPIFVLNDVRAATWAEWLYGAGQGVQDVLCLFVGTGIGGGIVSGGRMLTGCSNTCGEVGHVTVHLNGPVCTCGNAGCLEALAGGWAIARDAQSVAQVNMDAGKTLLTMADYKVEAITAKMVIEAAHHGDPLSEAILDQVKDALIGGVVGFVNAFNPQRLILGGGIIEGAPELITKIEAGVRIRSLQAATRLLEVLPAKLHKDSGVIGAAAVAMHASKNPSEAKVN